MMSDDHNDGQMIFGNLGGLKLPDICLTGEEKPRINLTQETCPDRGSNPGPLRDRRACYRLSHSGGIKRDIIIHNNIVYFFQLFYLTLTVKVKSEQTLKDLKRS